MCTFNIVLFIIAAIIIAIMSYIALKPKNPFKKDRDYFKR